MKLKLAEASHSRLWTNKARDHEGLVDDIFKLNVIGDDLKCFLLLMLNKIKQERMIPILMNITNITTVPNLDYLC